MEDLLISLIIQILDISVDNDKENAQFPNSIEFKCEISIH